MKPNKLSKIGFLKFVAFVVAMLMLAACQAGNATETQIPTIDPTPSQTAEPTTVPTQVPPTPTEELEQPITDLWAFLEEDTPKTVERLGFKTYQELLDILVYAGKYDDPKTRYLLGDGTGFIMKYAHAYVTGVSEVELTEASEFSPHGTKAYVLIVAAEGTTQEAAVLCGLDTPDGYAAICPKVLHGPGGREEVLSDPGAFGALVGRKMLVGVVSTAGGKPEMYEALKQELIIGGSGGDFPSKFQHQIQDRLDAGGELALDAFWNLLGDKQLIPQRSAWYPDIPELKNAPVDDQNSTRIVEWLLRVMRGFEMHTPIIIPGQLGDVKDVTIEEMRTK